MHGLDEPVSLDLIASIGGIRAIGVVRVLLDGERTETELAERLGLSEQAVRGILQRLYDAKLASFRKERREDGWFVYHWSLRSERLSDVVSARKRTTLSLLRRRLEFERSNHFFMCPSRCRRLTFEEGFEHDFLCPSCGGVLRQHDNDFAVEELTSYIERLEEAP